jgi:aconitase A
MMRGTFANIRIKNEMVPGSASPVRRREPAIFDAAEIYRAAGTPLVVIAGGNAAPARRATGRLGGARKRTKTR